MHTLFAMEESIGGLLKNVEQYIGVDVDRDTDRDATMSHLRRIGCYSAGLAVAVKRRQCREREANLPFSAISDCCGNAERKVKVICRRL